MQEWSLPGSALTIDSSNFVDECNPMAPAAAAGERGRHLYRRLPMRKLHFLVAATALALILAVAWSARGPVAAQEKPGKALQKWEYKVETVNAIAAFQAENGLNKRAPQGWNPSPTELNAQKTPDTFLIFNP